MYIIRFDARHVGHTHLARARNSWVVGKPTGPTATHYTADEAARFETEAMAYEALGRFIEQRNMLGDQDWVSNPKVIPAPVTLLATVTVEGGDITLTNDGVYFHVTDAVSTSDFRDLDKATAFLGACVRAALDA